MGNRSGSGLAGHPKDGVGNLGRDLLLEEVAAFRPGNPRFGQHSGDVVAGPTEDRVAVAEGAGLKAIVMDVDLFAAQSAFELIEATLPERGHDLNIAVVDIGASNMNVNVLRNDQSIYMREQPFGGSQLTQEIQRRYSLSAEEAEIAKRSGGLPVGPLADLCFSGTLTRAELQRRFAGQGGLVAYCGTNRLDEVRRASMVWGKADRVGV